MNKRIGFTLVEVMIASAVLVIFFSGSFALFFQGQGTITKSTWISNSTRDEGLALKELSELAKSSSYPSTVLSNIIKVCETKTYQAKLPAGKDNIQLKEYPLDILAFPICTEQNENTAGSIKWVILRLQNHNASPDRCNLSLIISKTNNYNPPPPNYVTSLNSFGYSNSIEAAKEKILLRDIESLSITAEKGNDNAVSSVKIDFNLSYSKAPNFKKTATIKFPMNVLVDY